jgi:glycine cleavage system H protein
MVKFNRKKNIIELGLITNTLSFTLLSAEPFNQALTNEGQKTQQTYSAFNNDATTKINNIIYSENYQYVKVDGNLRYVGISDYAQKQLGDIVYVELPEIGRRVKKGDVLGVIESSKTVSEFYSPVSGKIINVNNNLENNPGLINKYPEADGWIVIIELDP